MRTIFTALVLAAALMLAASAQQVPPAQVDPAAEEASIHGYGDKDKTCAEWTDGCRTCRRGPNDEVVCPNIGPACQPKPITCVQRSEQPK